MSLAVWLTQLVGRSLRRSPRAARVPAPDFRPRLESLEDRLVLATLNKIAITSITPPALLQSIQDPPPNSVQNPSGTYVLATFKERVAVKGAKPRHTFVVTIEWGDGTSSTKAADPKQVQVVATSATTWNVVGTHTYPTNFTSGTFSITISDTATTAAVKNNPQTASAHLAPKMDLFM